MIKINRENYEIWFIDFIDGKLDDEARGELDAFLQTNPDLKEELNAFEEWNLEPSVISYNNAGRLYKNESDLMEISRSDYLLVKQMEEGLTEEEEKELASIIREDESLIRRGVEFQHSRLTSESTPYERKSSLLQNRIRPGWLTFGRIAAAAIVVALLMTFWDPDFILSPKKNELAMQTLHSLPAVVTAPDVPDAKLAKVVLINHDNNGIISQPVANIASSEVLDEDIPENEDIHAPELMVKLTSKPVKLELAGQVFNAYETGLRHMMPLYLDINRDQKRLLSAVEPKSVSQREGNFLMKSLQFVDRVSGDLVNFDKLYDENGNFVAYNFKAGYFEVEQKLRR